RNMSMPTCPESFSCPGFAAFKYPFYNDTDELCRNRRTFHSGDPAFSAGAVTILIIIILCLKRIYGWRKKAVYNVNVEIFLKNQEFLAPKRYSYSQIKKMTNSFEVKLGQGGFGSVYRGELRGGNLVAVKILSELKGNVKDFVNEVASVGRTCHVNIASLVGFCLEGRRRALIYEFMPNGSLEKFIYGRGSSSNSHLGWEKLHQIAIGIARGLEYLHRGCNTRILHFDIKPHNILLDQDFCPKISDFGLAKLFPEKRSMISLTDMRGTPGYIAPELFSRNFGGVSNKSDVYSYGMMILEMVGGRKNVQVEVDHTSEIYFPHWIYKKVELHEEQLGLHGILSEVESEMARKMIIVGLWCIQTNSLSRPTMTKIEMGKSEEEPQEEEKAEGWPESLSHEDFKLSMTTSSANNSIFRGFFEKQKLTGPNFINWYRQLRIVLSIEDKLNYLEQPIPPTPVAPTGQHAAPEILAAHNAWIKGSKEIVGLMLMTMEPEIQRNMEPLHAHEMLRELKTLFAQQAEQELLQTTRDFHSCKEEEGQSVSSYILKMKGYIDNLERLGHPVTLGLGVSLILIGLRKEYDGFVQNYNMYSMKKTFNELHAMLKLHEQTLPKNNAPVLYAIRAGKVQKVNKHKKSQTQMAARGQNHEKEKNKQAYAPRPKIPLPPKREDPTKDSICYECASGAGGSGIFVIELNTILNRSWIYDTSCGTHIYNTTQGLRARRKLKPGLLACTWAMVNVKLLKQLALFIYVSRVD
nr:protein kinase-like domain, concanavalin A-like lectin/glucanase domain protein [Tanacetum cinerariifolium]